MEPQRESHQSTMLLAGAVTVLLAILLYVLGPSLFPAPQPIQGTKVYFADRISPTHKKIIDRFNALHQGRIEVVPVDLPFEKFSTNERKELLARSLRSRSDKLDVFCVDLIWVERFARWCEPLDRYFPPEKRDAILPSALASCFSESTLVAMPLLIDIGLMYYREDLIRRLPDAAAVEEKLRASMSWPEFLGLRQRLGDAGKPYYVFQADEYEGLICNYLEVVAQHDRRAVSPGGIDLGSPAARSGLQLLVDLVHKNGASPRDVVGFDEIRSYRFMLDNDAVFVRGWPNFVENFRVLYPDTARLDRIRTAALPHVEGREPTSVFGGWNLMLSRFSTRKPEALEFIRFLVTKEAQQILYEGEGFLPVASSIYADSAYMTAHPSLAFCSSLLKRGFHRPSLVDYTRISDVLSHYVRLAILGDLSVDEALRRASQMISEKKVLIK
jgi:multiple sugar transport system substrate-binding protein